MAEISAWKSFWDRRRQLLLFALIFQTVESLCFVPLLGLAGHALLGRPVVDSTQLVSFVLSPRGFVLLSLIASIFVMIRLLEHGGLSVIALGGLQGKTGRNVWAVRLRLYKFPRVAFIGERANGCVLLAAGWSLLREAFYAHG